MAATSVGGGEEGDPYSNVLHSVDHLHFGAVAIEHEIEALVELGYNMVLEDGAEIGTKTLSTSLEVGGEKPAVSKVHGLTAEGLLTPEAFKALGVEDSVILWMEPGGVRAKADGLVAEGCTVREWERLENARKHIEDAMCNHQMETILMRDKAGQSWSRQQSKEARERVFQLGTERVREEVERDEKDMQVLDEKGNLPEERMLELDRDDVARAEQIELLRGALFYIEKLLSDKTRPPNEEQDDAENGEGGEHRNWNPPRSDLDFAAKAGESEFYAVDELGFNLVYGGHKIRDELPGKRVHGVDELGYLTDEALGAIGVGNFSRLWRSSGRVAEEAWQLCSRGTLGERRRVERARDELEKCVVYRQMDLLVYREKGEQEWEWRQHAECKRRIQKRGFEAIVGEVRRDCADREQLRMGGGSLTAQRKRELESACPNHVHELDMRLETLAEVRRFLGEA